MVKNVLDVDGIGVLGVVDFVGFVPEIPGINHPKQVVYKLNDLCLVRFVEKIHGVDVLLAVEIRDYILDYFVNFFFFFHHCMFSYSPTTIVGLFDLMIPKGEFDVNRNVDVQFGDRPQIAHH